jgi:hypothetical protein
LPPIPCASVRVETVDDSLIHFVRSRCLHTAAVLLRPRESENPTGETASSHTPPPAHTRHADHPPQRKALAVAVRGSSRRLPKPTRPCLLILPSHCRLHVRSVGRVCPAPRAPAPVQILAVCHRVTAAIQTRRTTNRNPPSTVTTPDALCQVTVKKKRKEKKVNCSAIVPIMSSICTGRI